MHEEKIASMENELKVNCWINQFESAQRDCSKCIERMHINQHVLNSKLEWFIQFQSKDKMQEEKIASLENDLKVNCWSNQFEKKVIPEKKLKIIILNTCPLIKLF